MVVCLCQGNGDIIQWGGYFPLMWLTLAWFSASHTIPWLKILSLSEDSGMNPQHCWVWPHTNKEINEQIHRSLHRKKKKNVEWILQNYFTLFRVNSAIDRSCLEIYIDAYFILEKSCQTSHSTFSYGSYYSFINKQNFFQITFIPVLTTLIPKISI